VAAFCVEMFVIYVLWNDQIDPDWRNRLTLLDCAILAYFVALWWYAQHRPVLSCALALVGFWTEHILLAMKDPQTLGQLLVVKVLFTIALIKGIGSAIRAERLRRQLGRVFD
jgi:hypothetical protein